MLKVNISGNDRPAVVRVGGETNILTAEVCAVIGTIYANMYRKSKPDAKAFRSTLLSVLADPDSPAWDVEMALRYSLAVIDEDELRRQMEAEE